MTSRWGETVVHCDDPAALARFWTAVLDWVIVEETSTMVEIAASRVSDEQRLADLRAGTAAAPSIVFNVTTEPKRQQNRMHLDVSPIDGSHDEEVRRILDLGAVRADVSQPDDASWTVLTDPAGNEFCVVRSLAPGHFSLDG